MKTFYVSLVRDLLGAYLVYNAQDEAAVRTHLAASYLDPTTKVWKLPWCAIYDHVPPVDADRAILVPAACGPLS
jgi:hypothetical protein